MIEEIRDADEAQQYLLEGLWLTQVLAPAAPGAVRRALEWALELSAAGESLLPVGAIADLGHLALGMKPSEHHARVAVPGYPSGLARSYEDNLLGRLYADSAFDRASAAVSHYQGRDRARGLAFLLARLRERCDMPAVLLNPALLKSLIQRPPDELLAEGWELLARDGLSPRLAEQYEQMVAAVRNTGDLLGAEDVFELEHGTALAEFSQRIALRQVLEASALLGAGMARPRPRTSRVHEVATQILDEDLYPVGGFVSISNRGTIESLLHSQLAMMERDEALRPDLFDIKFLRDELLYYSRDENQFHRRRRTFVLALFPDLEQARIKDPHAPWQRLVLALAMLRAAIERTIEWLAADALVFEIVFVEEGGTGPLAAERKLLEMIFSEAIELGTVRISSLAPAALGSFCTDRARKSLCHLLTVSRIATEVSPDRTVVERLVLEEARPTFAVGDDAPGRGESEEPVEAWRETLTGLLAAWVG